TASSWLPVTFTSSTRDVCTVSGAALTPTAAGTCTIVASQPGDARYAPAGSQTGFFPVGKIAQTISFALTASATADPPVTLTATPSSGLPVVYASGSRDVCTVSGSTLTFAKAGTCTVTASQPGDGKYAPADPMSGSFPVGKIPQTISFTPPDGAEAGQRVVLSASATSKLAVSFASATQGVCTVSDRTATTIKAGACVIVASPVGDDRYAPARDEARSFRVERATQIITFTPPDGMSLGQPVTLSASATSGLMVSFRSDTPSVCTVSGDTVTAIAAGTCTVTASQGGS